MKKLNWSMVSSLVWGIWFKNLLASECWVSPWVWAWPDLIDLMPSIFFNSRQEVLHGYTTSAYTLHILTTPTNHTFALFTSPMPESLRPTLKTLWRTAWLDFVVRN
jgi:hypothetical protein